MDQAQPLLAVVLFALLIGAAVYLSRPTLLVVAGVYSVHGVVLQVVRTVRHRLASHPPRTCPPGSLVPI